MVVIVVLSRPRMHEVSLGIVLYYVDSAIMERATREMIVCKQ